MKGSLILGVSARYLLAFAIPLSLFVLLRGHNEPGGGFIGGLIGATGFVVYAIAAGTSAARDALRVAPERIAMAGLGIALLAGVAAVLDGDVFFTGQWFFLGATETEKGLPLSTVLVFDVGVYLVVMGSILSLAFALEESI